MPGIIDYVACKYIDRIFVCRLKINHAWSTSSCDEFLGNFLVVAKQKDLTVMEETCDWRAHTHLGRVVAESGIQQSKSIVVIYCTHAIITQ
jgi:hypothetical protein